MNVSLKSKTIVVIDDEPDICEALELALGLEGYGVKVAQDRAGALRALEQTEPSIILLDYRIPGLDPCQFMQELRALRITAPVVLMTAGRDPGEKARELGLTHFLPKPFELEEMLALVRRCTSTEGD